MTDSPVPAKGSIGLLYGVAFLLSFCSLSYELLVATKIARVVGDALFTYPASVGLFILFKGIAHAVWYWRASRNDRHVLGILVVNELLVTLLACVSVATIDLSLVWSATLPVNPIAAAILVVAAIGFLTGQELPLLLRFGGCVGLNQAQARRLVLLDYAACLVASLVFALVLLPRLGLFEIAFLVGLVNACTIAPILWLARQERPGVWRLAALATVTLVAALVCVAPATDRLESALIEKVYFPANDGVLAAKLHTPYQEALLFVMRRDCRPLTESMDRVLANPDAYVSFATLNGDVQFLKPLATRADPYHALMVDPFFDLLPKLDTALILGGGSGNAALRVLGHGRAQSVTMVDIDSAWVQFAATDPLMRTVNHEALIDPRLELDSGDAFRWVRNTSASYDAIITDFPEGISVAAARKYSLQFLNDLRRILTDQGVIVFQADIRLSDEFVASFYKTAETAGLFPLYGHRSWANIYDTEVTQFAMFKSAEARQRFRSQFDGPYCEPPVTDESRRSVCRTRYMDVVGAASPISYYDPTSLNEIVTLILRHGYYKQRYVEYLHDEVCRRP